MFELAKQLRISILVCGGFANFPILGTGELAKPNLWMSVRFANSLGGWCVSWQSNYGFVQWSVAALPTHHTACWRVGKTYFYMSVRFANSLGGGCLSWQSNYGSVSWSVAALPTHHTACRGVGKISWIVCNEFGIRVLDRLSRHNIKLNPRDRSGIGIRHRRTHSRQP